MSANPHCTLPDYVIDPLSDTLDSIEVLAERLRKHAMAYVNDDDPDELNQRELVAHIDGIFCIAKELGRRVESLREPHGRRNGFDLELTQANAIGLKCLADSWNVSMEIAAGRIVMEELQRRFGLPEEPKKAA